MTRYPERGGDPIAWRGMRFVRPRDLQAVFGPHLEAAEVAECQHGLVTVLVPGDQLRDARVIAPYVQLQLLERGVRVLRLKVLPKLPSPEATP